MYLTSDLEIIGATFSRGVTDVDSDPGIISVTPETASWGRGKFLHNFFVGIGIEKSGDNFVVCMRDLHG